MISLEIDDIADAKWNKRLEDASLGSIHQTNEFAVYTQKVFNQKPKYIKFLKPDGEIVGQLLMHQYSRFEKKGITGKFFKKVIGSRDTIFRWRYGPIIFKSDLADDIWKSLYDFCSTKNCKVIGIEFPLLAKPLKNPFVNKPWATFMIDLSESLDVIKERMHKHSAQKNIRRSENRGVTINEITKKDLPTIHNLIQKTKGESKTASIEDVKIMWDCLHNIGMHGFLAYYEDKPIGGIMASSFNGYINEFGIARTQKDSEDKLYSQDLLKWYIINWGTKNNLKYYDLTGVNPNPQNEKEKGIFRYKEKWGGKLVKYNHISL